jgi:class 3 adenylate cyclase
LLGWRALGGEVRLIDLAELRGGPREGTRTAAVRSRPAEAHRPTWGRRQIMTMLFGDVVGFSKLREAEAPAFFVNFLGLVARQMEQSATPPASCNTWGDGLYIVFDDAAAAAGFALGLRDRIARTDWQSHDLPVGLSARIGMHSGPVFQAFDPIIQRINYFGSHVTRSARIEPVTAPGSVYVSEQTAALLAAGGNRDFACDYLGQMALAKGYGRTVLYRLRRASEDE